MLEHNKACGAIDFQSKHAIDDLTELGHKSIISLGQEVFLILIILIIILMYIALQHCAFLAFNQ